MTFICAAYHGISQLSLVVLDIHTRLLLFYAMPELSQQNECNIRAEHDGKAGYNTIEYTTAFLYSKWVYFPWHGINKYIERVCGVYQGNILKFLFYRLNTAIS